MVIPKEDIKRLYIVVAIPVVICLWLLVCFDWYLRTGFIYLILVIAALAGGVIYREMFG